LDFDQRPLVVIWEVTQACDLACVHCRACAQPLRNLAELTTTEGRRLIDDVADLQSPVFVFTGGDPLKRADIYQLVAYAAERGVHPSMTPSATPLLTRDAIAQLKSRGLHRLAISLDGPTPESHDSFRGVQGSFARTLSVMQWAHEVGLPVQINTTITRRNFADIDSIASILNREGIVLWSVFFLVPTGRGQVADLLSPEEFEQVFAKLHDVSQRVSFHIKTTEAQHFRRFLLQQNKAKANGRSGGVEDALASAPPELAAELAHARRGINDGKGFVFISHLGEVFPSGFLPLRAGSVRDSSLGDIYRNSPVMRLLRDTSRLKGKCGACRFKDICGGSRARAYALTGDLLAEEPCCSYLPPHYTPSEPTVFRVA
jgi:radical SAM protein